MKSTKDIVNIANFNLSYQLVLVTYSTSNNQDNVINSGVSEDSVDHRNEQTRGFETTHQYLKQVLTEIVGRTG